jgi:hypothetical protein
VISGIGKGRRKILEKLELLPEIKKHNIRWRKMYGMFG